MELTGWKGSLYRYGNWAMKLACLNLLWLAGIAIGAGIAGFFPSTAAMFSVIRKWLQEGNLDLPLLAHFKQAYRKDFLKSNLYGYSWLIIGAILYVDLQFFRGIPTLWAALLSYVFFILGAIYIGALLFAFPVYVQFNLTILQYIRNTVLITLSNPLYAVFMALGFYFPYYAMMKIPGLLPFFGGTLIAFPLMHLSYRLFELLEKKAAE
ncbi:hypothetical protein A8F94_19155 [Bacillus sp. FJAT-27225]|uniref:YesL family protein n=1 Tax=Bacillus sp. FJAT-27225 TaxID=1743144 RepID=UPI00080C319F|nr:DUF624 domain-containing protein [Bacillus sp. FJAT-27225]OCA83227.1 hypothetical protein A8F94_19155 [Bacillus sp. FJAT-27225]